MSAVELDDVTFRYAGVDAAALAGVSLSVAEGTTCWVYGSPGAGASTLLLAADSIAIADEGTPVAAEIVMDVAEVEERLEALGIHPHGFFVQRFRFDELVALVADVREVHDRGHQVRIEQQRPPVG